MDIAQTIANFFLITLLGLLIAFSPSLIIINLLLTLKSAKPIRDTIVLIAGAILPLIILLLVLIFWVQPDGSFRLGHSLSQYGIPPLIDLLVGLSLLGYAAWRRFGRQAVIKKPKGMSERTKKMIANPSSIFSFAFVRSSLSVIRLLAVIYLAKTIVLSGRRPIVEFLATVWVIALAMAPLIAAPFLYKYRPQVLETTQAGIDRLMARDLSNIVTLIITLVGAWLTVHGFLQLDGVIS